MMTKIQHALGKLAEEAAEVAQRAIKAQQFGMDEIQPGPENPNGLTNAERLKYEIMDLKAAEFRLVDLGVMPDVDRHLLIQHIMAKDSKVDRFYALSKSLGQVE